MGLHKEILQPFSHVPCKYTFVYVTSECRYNFLDKVKVHMGAVKAYTWMELIEQAEIAEKSAKKLETPKAGGKSTTKLNLMIH